MNLSQSSSSGNEKYCKSIFFESLPLQYSSADSFYGLLVAAAVLSLTACPFIIFLNALVMVAVKTKRRLQSHPNILLACLALSDLMVGLVVQPLHVTETIFLLQGKDFHEFCDIELTLIGSFVVSCYISVLHLALISGERYLAIKHTFTHATVITKTRLLICSAGMWITAVLCFSVFSSSNVHARVVTFVLITTTFSSIILLQILVYKEARRHEKQILSQQVSLEARAKFEREKKALKLTTIILVTLFLFVFLPIIVIFVTWRIFGEQFSPLGRLPVIFNSFLNPLIHSVRKREFRVAFVELLSRKTFQEAEEFERTLFGRNAVIPQDGQDGERVEQIPEERNTAHANEGSEDQS